MFPPSSQEEKQCNKRLISSAWRSALGVILRDLGDSLQPEKEECDPVVIGRLA